MLVEACFLKHLAMDALGASQMAVGFHAYGALLKPRSAQGASTVKLKMQGWRLHYNHKP